MNIILSVDDRNLDNPVNITGSREGIDYYNVDTLNLDLGSGDNVVNIRGTTAITNIYGYDGNERFYVSSLAKEDLVSALTTDFLEGNLDFIRGNLNISAGAGRQLLFISDEASVIPDQNVKVTDNPASPTALPGTEIEISGFALAAIDYQAAANGNYAKGITMWAGYGDDAFLVDGTHYRNVTLPDGNKMRTITTLNTGL